MLEYTGDNPEYRNFNCINPRAYSGRKSHYLELLTATNINNLSFVVVLPAYAAFAI
jgi:hypothetical protein